VLYLLILSVHSARHHPDIRDHCAITNTFIRTCLTCLSSYFGGLLFHVSQMLWVFTQKNYRILVTVSSHFQSRPEHRSAFRCSRPHNSSISAWITLIGANLLNECLCTWYVITSSTNPTTEICSIYLVPIFLHTCPWSLYQQILYLVQLDQQREIDESHIPGLTRDDKLAQE